MDNIVIGGKTIKNGSLLLKVKDDVIEKIKLVYAGNRLRENIIYGKGAGKENYYGREEYDGYLKKNGYRLYGNYAKYKNAIEWEGVGETVVGGEMCRVARGRIKEKTGGLEIYVNGGTVVIKDGGNDYRVIKGDESGVAGAKDIKKSIEDLVCVIVLEGKGTGGLESFKEKLLKNLNSNGKIFNEKGKEGKSAGEYLYENFRYREKEKTGNTDNVRCISYKREDDKEIAKNYKDMAVTGEEGIEDGEYEGEYRENYGGIENYEIGGIYIKKHGLENKNDGKKLYLLERNIYDKRNLLRKNELWLMKNDFNKEAGLEYLRQFDRKYIREYINNLSKKSVEGNKTYKNGGGR